MRLQCRAGGAAGRLCQAGLTVPGSLLYVLYVLYGSQATEHPLSPGSLLYALYVLYGIEACILYEAVSDYVGDWLQRAQVLLLTGAKSQIKLSHIRKKNPGAGLVRAWCGAGLVRAWCALACEGVVRQTHYPRQPADAEASKVGPPPVLVQKRTYLRKLAPKRGWCV